MAKDDSAAYEVLHIVREVREYALQSSNEKSRSAADQLRLEVLEYIADDSVARDVTLEKLVLDAHRD
jgi:hypothetical protein